MQGAGTCESCNGRGIIETTSHNTTGRYDRRDGRGRGERGNGHGGRDRGRTSYSSNWRHGGRGDGHNTGSDRHGDHARGLDARDYDARIRGDRRNRDNFSNIRANFSSSRRRGGGGRGG